MMLDLALTYPEYRDSAAKVQLVETTADAYYGRGYQDVQNRVPKIDNTSAELGWHPVARSSAYSAPAFSPRCSAPRSSATTASRRCSTARCFLAPTSGDARATSCGAPATKASKSAFTPGITSSGRTDSTAPAPNGP